MANTDTKSSWFGPNPEDTNPEAESPWVCACCLGRNEHTTECPLYEEQS